ncbi:hypothetical protein MRX96_014212 [Rhipicephalus microplus]
MRVERGRQAAGGGRRKVGTASRRDGNQQQSAWRCSSLYDARLVTKTMARAGTRSVAVANHRLPVFFVAHSLSPHSTRGFSCFCHIPTPSLLLAPGMYSVLYIPMRMTAPVRIPRGGASSFAMKRSAAEYCGGSAVDVSPSRKSSRAMCVRSRFWEGADRKDHRSTNRLCICGGVAKCLFENS